jgi:hypothetical protein
MRPRVLKFIAAVAAGAALAACATPGLYQQADAEAGRAGYAETRLGDGVWRVEFVGDDFTSRETVETYLLYRAAELAAENGYDWFASTSPAISEETEVIVEAARVDPYRARYWRPQWRQRSRFHWSDVDPAGPIPREPREPNVRTSVHYSATAELQLGRGPMPEGAFDARATLTELGPSVVRP